jgi:DNA-binding transcriptional LysR family regulator
MVRNETRLMESAVALAEELHFSRTARRIGISQPMLTKNIQDLESLLGGALLSEIGRMFT